MATMLGSRSSASPPTLPQPAHETFIESARELARDSYSQSCGGNRESDTELNSLFSAGDQLALFTWTTNDQGRSSQEVALISKDSKLCCRNFKTAQALALETSRKILSTCVYIYTNHKLRFLKLTPYFLLYYGTSDPFLKWQAP